MPRSSLLIVWQVGEPAENPSIKEDEAEESQVQGHCGPQSGRLPKVCGGELKLCKSNFNLYCKSLHNSLSFTWQLNTPFA